MTSLRRKPSPPPPTTQDVGNAVSRLLFRHHVNASDVARGLGYDVSTWTRIARGNRYPTLPQLFELAEVLGITVREVFDEVVPPVVSAQAEVAVAPPAGSTADDDASLLDRAQGGFVALGEILRRLAHRTQAQENPAG